MGIGMGSRSSCSCFGCNSAPPPVAPPLPNPDPKKFTIVKTYEARGWAARFSAVGIKYDGCTNYEGLKILVFEHPLSTIQSLTEIDPHFCDSYKKY